MNETRFSDETRNDYHEHTMGGMGWLGNERTDGRERLWGGLRELCLLFRRLDSDFLIFLCNPVNQRIRLLRFTFV